jgi:hypothetical protein
VDFCIGCEAIRAKRGKNREYYRYKLQRSRGSGARASGLPGLLGD